VQGEFPWDHHDTEDEFFMVWKGRFRVEFSDHVVELGPGECLVVPRGSEHRTCADEEAEILLIEPTGLVNTGNVTDAAFTAPTGVFDLKSSNYSRSGGRLRSSAATVQLPRSAFSTQSSGSAYTSR
jgi:D-lyxose ketol-isomerase